MSTSAKITLFHNKLFSPPAVSSRRAFRCYMRFVCVPARRRLQTLLQVCAEGRRRRCRDMLQIPPSVINHMKPATSGSRQKQKCATEHISSTLFNCKQTHPRKTTGKLYPLRSHSDRSSRLACCAACGGGCTFYHHILLRT